MITTLMIRKEEYVKDKVHEEQTKEEYGDSYARYTDPQMGPEDDRGRSYKPHHRRATNLEKIGFAMNIAALICCCCANIYLTLGVSIMSLAVLICSLFFANEDHHFLPYCTYWNYYQQHLYCDCCLSSSSILCFIHSC